MPPSGTFIQVSVGGYHACGIKSDGTLAGWGLNDYGQSTTPAGTFTQLSAGAYHACGIKTDSTLVCWGNPDYGQSTVPDGMFTQLSAGYYHTCAVKSDGTLACWGFNVYGQATPPGGTFTQVSAGDWHTCGIKSNGTLICWGNNEWGQAPSIGISPASLPDGDKGVAYSQTLVAGSGTAPYSFSLAAGSLPPSLTLSSDGLLSGTPTTDGTYTFTIQAADSSFPLAGSRTYTIQIITVPPNKYWVYLPVLLK